MPDFLVGCDRIIVTRRLVSRNGFSNGVSHLFSGLIDTNLKPPLFLAVLDKTRISVVLLPNPVNDGIQDHGLVQLGFGRLVFGDVLVDNGAKALVARSVVAPLAAATDDVVCAGLELGRQFGCFRSACQCRNRCRKDDLITRKEIVFLVGLGVGGGCVFGSVCQKDGYGWVFGDHYCVDLVVLAKPREVVIMRKRIR